MNDAMLNEEKQKWIELCKLAAEEQDPEKFMALVREMNRLVAAKEERLEQAQIPATE
jgi:hypothetical protein